jgi:DNA-binding beta-propeller fold protein YncE
MFRHLLALPFGAAVVLLPGLRPASIDAETARELFQSTEPAEMCLMPPKSVSYSSRGGDSAQKSPGGAEQRLPPGWPGEQAMGGDVHLARTVFDPHPTFNGMAIDTRNGVVVMSDENRHSLLMYDLTAGGQSAFTTEPKRHIVGGRVNLGFIAGVALDPIRREVFTVNNDEGGLAVHSYDGHGDVPPLRTLTVPHQSWGLSLDIGRDELAVTSQQYQGISIYSRTASKADRPLRTIRGGKTMLADPHGVFLDGTNDEVFSANHGNWTELRTYAAGGPPLLVGEYVPGRFEQPSIRVHRATADGDVPPLRTIQGPKTRLAWPMGIVVDRQANEFVVANYSTDQILFYDRRASGDVPPVRILGGDRTGIVGPISVEIDRKNSEIWVANYGDHTAVVFDLQASGNVSPKRIVRNAPAGTPTTGFTNASAAAYDTKRDQLLVPN